MITEAEARVQLSRVLNVHGITANVLPLKPQTGPVDAYVFADETRVFKVFSPLLRERADLQAARQAEVSSHGLAPQVLLYDDLVFAMPRLDGPDISHSPQLEDIQAAGLWLNTFHGLTERKFPFRPIGQLRWIARLLQQADARTRFIPDPDSFRLAAKRTEDYAQDTRKQKSRRAVTHRDMTLTNLVRHGNRLYGIDFENSLEDEPLRDLFTLLLDLATMEQLHLLAPLRESYGDKHTAAPVRLFLQRCFCLWVWANTPEHPSRRHLRRLAFAKELLAEDVLIL
ncbi:phosphotransferase [Sagittula sp. SSi028]|uniref:phosphotransferase n=1 Tax=Sagittula sp. SSi028 TaxID=3400636 RepID=UPI003AF47EB8